MRKVVLADSASVTHFLLERMLGSEGFEVLYVRYPRDLIRMVKENMPDLIFLEAEISGGKGQKIVTYLARQPETRHIPIVLITRISDTNPSQMRNWPGVHRVLRKPLKHQNVWEAIHSLPDFGEDTPHARSEAG